MLKPVSFLILQRSKTQFVEVTVLGTASSAVAMLCGAGAKIVCVSFQGGSGAGRIGQVAVLKYCCARLRETPLRTASQRRKD